MSDIPSPEKPEITFNYQALVPHEEAPCFLALPVDGGWALPSFTTGEHPSDSRLGRVASAMSKQLGAHLTVLRSLYSESDREVEHRFDAVYLLENHTPDWTPTGGARWVGRDALDSVGVAGPKFAAAIDEWLGEVERGEVPASWAPWASAGWYDRAAAWIAAQLSKLGLEPLGPVEQMRHWCISSIMRVPTPVGYIYFKAVPQLFAREPVLTAALAARYPESIPTPLAIEVTPDEGWMLMPEFGSKLSQDTAFAPTESVVRALAHIQVESAGNIDELFAEGCPDRRLHTLPGELRALLADESVLADLTDAEREKLVGFTPKIEAICERLAGYAVPHSLVHGDFHSNNIAIKEGKPVIFDWTDGCVAHPFVDLPVLLEYDTPKDVPDARERIRDAYLQAWTAYEPMERLVEAFALGEVVAALHQAISYRYIVASLDDSQKGQLHGGTSQWLRVLLRYAD